MRQSSSAPCRYRERMTMDKKEMELELEKKRCNTCIYYDPFTDDEGECRRYAPKPFISKVSDEELEYCIIFPLVTWRTDWCGEHKEDKDGT